MKKCIKIHILWSLPDTTKKIKTEYILEVPKGITPSFYKWVAGDHKIPYKTQCFINRLRQPKKD